MSFTYTYQPSTVNRDAVRLALGDTDSSDPLLYDGEIDYCLSQGGAVAAAAVAGCELILRKLARRVNVSADGVSKSLSDQYAHYQGELVRLKAKIGRSVAPFAGGLSVADKQAREGDSDRVEPSFRRDLFTVDGRRRDDDDGTLP